MAVFMNIGALITEMKLWFGTATEVPFKEVSKEIFGTELPVKAEPPSPPPDDRLCFVVDDEPAVRHLISMVLKPMGIQVEEFASAPALMEGLERRRPQLIFLDISLERSDAVEALQGLAAQGYPGAVNLMSGRHGQLLDDISKMGERHDLRMLPVLLKPFGVATVRAVASAIFAAPSKMAPRVTVDEALQNDWLKVWYQPKIDLKRKLLVGCEALARIQHPQHGLILPGAFLPEADTDSLSRLTERVLLTVLRDSVQFKETGASLKPAVNIPFDVLLGTPVAALVRENKPKGDAWKGLIVEVTEDQIARDVDRALDIATQLKIYDISLSIDDFGAGHSSFARLKHFPFAELKLDMNFVQGCSSNPQNAALCKAAIDLAHGFGAIAVAEGIEQADDLRALFNMGCDLGQGYLLAAPMPMERFIRLLERRAQKPAAQERIRDEVK
jgi:EAL domain-containing protein (putative c-di-GMP-specific phosphodiesterase class I)/CheY-like chemotaxis protein